MTTLETSEQRASRACLECRTSKTRCIWPTELGVGKCRRCSRSKRACTLTQSSASPRKFSSRVGQLEDKIDSLVSLLHANQQVPSKSTPSEHESPSCAPPFITRALPTGKSNDQRPMLGPSPPGTGFHSSYTTPSSAYDTPASLDPIEVIPNFTLSLEAADRLLDLYRASFSPDFPFVPLPQRVTAFELHSTQPLLFRVVMHVVAPQSYAAHLAFGQWFREYIAQHVVIAQEQKLEILQSIVLYIAWADFRFYRGNEVSNLVQLALSQVIAAGLSQPPRWPEVPASLLQEVVQARGLKVPGKHSLEQIRAMFGCFFLCESLSSLFRRMPQFPYSRYLATCCAELTSAQEYASDHLLVALVQMQHITSRVRPPLPFPETDDVGAIDFHPSLYMTMTTARNELEYMKNAMPREVQDHAIFAANYHGSLTRIYEPAIYTKASSMSISGGSSTHRTGALWSCLEATNQFFEAFLNMPPVQLSYAPFPITGILSFAMITTSWLMLLSDSDWDVQVARRSLDLEGIVDRISARFDEAERVGVAEERVRKRKFWDGDTSMAIRCRDKMRWFKAWYVAQVKPVPEAPVELSEMDADLWRQLDVVSADGLYPGFWEAMMHGDMGGGLQGGL